jgi:dihydroorotate dehydrogenase
MVGDDKILSSTVWNKTFANPIGLAAGYDKNGVAVGGMLGLGFSFVEIGSVTPHPQPGNPPPRVFRLSEDRGIINRYGFNSDGMGSVRRNLREFENNRSFCRQGLVGVNAGKNKSTPEDRAHEDYAAVIDT